jgi:outer membrane protein assembly factor BamB/tetratricopeptide (TPR) repeat protein
MRKLIIGRIGDPSFLEARRLLERGGKVTLFAHGGATEKALYLCEERVLVAARPRVEAANATGPLADFLAAAQKAAAKGENPGQDPAYLDAAKAWLRSVLNEIASWREGLFELREGPIPQNATVFQGAIEVRAPGNVVLEKASKSLRVPAAGWAPAAVFGGEPLSRVDAIAPLLPGALCRHVLIRELGAAWKALGSRRRAAECLRAVAGHYEDWGAGEAAVATLEEALQICPIDWKAAEMLIAAHQSAGRQKEAEAVAEGICGCLEGWKLHDLVLRLFKLLERAPESATLRRAGAEAMIRTGDVLHGLRELESMGARLSSQGDKEGAARAYSRMLEIDPSNDAARGRLSGSRRLAAAGGFARRWGPVAAAVAIAGGWLLWDMASASALAREERPQELKSQLEVVRRDSGSYPVSRHIFKLASIEEDLFRKAYEEERKLLRQAIAARRSGDLGTAYHLFGNLLRKSIIPLYQKRAEAGRSEIARLESRREELLDQARKQVQGKDYAAAFTTYAQILKDAQRSLFAADYSVPVLIETVPDGASIDLDGSQSGRSPRWVFISSDPDTVLRLSAPGFRALTLKDPLGLRLEAGNHCLRAALEPEMAWTTEGWGGVIARGGSVADPVLPVLGADGVLRGIDLRQRRPLWEVPLDKSLASEAAPFICGPAVLLASTDGRAVAFSLRTGRVAWTARVGAPGSPLFFAGTARGQVIAASGGALVVLNPWSGLPLGRIPLAAPAAAGRVAFWNDLVCLAGEKGSLTAVELPGGRRRFHREGVLTEGARILVAGDTLLAIGKGGTITGFSTSEGRKVWETRLPAECSAACAVAGGRLAVATEAGSVVCLDGRAGTPAWKASLDGKVREMVAGADGADRIAAVVQRGEESAVSVLDAADGFVRLEIPAVGAAPSAETGGGGLAASSATLGVFVVPNLPRRG